MAKKFTIRLDDDLARQIDDLSRKTQIPKVRLTKQAFAILLAFYQKLREQYRGEIVDMNFMDFIKINNHEDDDESA